MVVGPVTLTTALASGSTGLVTWTIRAVPAGGLMRLLSRTGSLAPMDGHVTVEVVLMSSAVAEVELQLAVAVKSE